MFFNTHLMHSCPDGLFQQIFNAPILSKKFGLMQLLETLGIFIKSSHARHFPKNADF